jgi:hypothetical protein
MRKITLAALLLTALTATAFAQQQREDPYAAEEQSKAREAAILDKKYKTILELTDKQSSGKVDPWRNMRGGDKPKQNR